MDLMVTEVFEYPSIGTAGLGYRQEAQNQYGSETDGREYVQARKSTQESKQISSGEKINKDPLQCHMCRKAGHTA